MESQRRQRVRQDLLNMSATLSEGAELDFDNSMQVRVLLQNLKLLSGRLIDLTLSVTIEAIKDE